MSEPETPVKPAKGKTIIARAGSSDHALFDISNSWTQFLIDCSGEDGMDVEEYDRRMEELVGSSLESIDRACSVLRQLEAQDGYLKAEQARLGEKRKRAQGHIEALKGSLLGVVKKMGGKVRTQVNNLGVGTSESVQLREGFPVLPEFGKTAEPTFVAALAKVILKDDPARAAALGIVAVGSEHLTRK